MRKFLFVAFLFLIAFSGCRESKPYQINIRGEVFGTHYKISYFCYNMEIYEQEIEDIFEEFNESLSYYRLNSLKSKINRNETDLVDDYIRVVFLRSQEISAVTDGAFDATVAPLVNAWGFGFKNMGEVTPKLIDSLREFTGYQKVQLSGDRIIKDDPRVQLDFNAIAKGYGADVVGAFLESKGITSYMVEIGGDLVVKGTKPDGSGWRIALESPAERADAPQQWEYYVEITDMAVATSGNYRQYYEVNGQRYSHTIDPFTGYPVTHNLLSVSVFASDAMTADAYATAFMVMGLEKAKLFLEENKDLQAYFIFSNDDGTYSSYATEDINLISRQK
jgi:FAD:protein FMN transferase